MARPTKAEKAKQESERKRIADREQQLRDEEEIRKEILAYLSPPYPID